MRTSRSDELATMLGVWGLPQPLTNGYPPLLCRRSLKWVSTLTGVSGPTIPR